jgi:hypothetical protein
VVVDRSALTVILLEPADAAVGAALLCDLHQRRVAVPDGWLVRDERASAMHAETESAPVESAPATAPVGSAPVGSAPVMAAPAVAEGDARPLLRRAFRAASPGSAFAREPRGLSWLERLHLQVDGGPQHAAERMDDDRQHDADADGDREDRDDRDVGRRQHDADDDRSHQHDRGDDGVHPDGADEVAFLALEDEATAGTPVGHLQPMTEDLALPADGTPREQGAADELPPARRGRGLRHGAQRMDNLTLFSDLSDVALGA